MQLLSQTRIEFSTTARQIDNNGFMHVEKVPMFRSGIIEIPGIELQGWVTEKLDYSKKYRLRIEQSVIEKSYETFAHKPITWGHKWVGKGNPKSDFIGFTGDAPAVDGDLIVNNLTIADADAVNRIGMKEREELSAGFTGEIMKSEVAYADYDLICMECNHVAVVKKGKAGHRVRILNEMIENGEINRTEVEGNNMTEEVKTQEEKAPETPPAEEKAPETPATETKPEEKAPEAEKAPETPAEPTKEEEKAPEGTKEEEKKEDTPPAEEKKEEPPKEEDKPADQETKQEEKATPAEPPKTEEKKEELHAWAYKIDGVVDINDAKDPDISGKSVTITFSAEDGFYEVKDGHVARIAMEDVINAKAEEKAKDVVEAYSICKEIDSNIRLKADPASMYKSVAKLVFGTDVENESETVLKRMLQGYLLGKGAKLSNEYGDKQDFRTIEVNL